MAGLVSRTFENYSELPGVILDFVSDTNEEDTSRIIDAAGLAGPTLKIFFEEVKKVFLKKMPTIGLYAALKARLPQIPDQILRRLVCDYVGYRFLSIDDFLDGQAAEALRRLGADPASYQVKRITFRAMTPTEIVTDILHDHPVNVPAFLEHRLREILESRVRGVRKDDETIQRLTRAEKIGGVELPQTEAETLVGELASKIASVNIASDNEVVEAKTENTPHPTLSPLGARGEKNEASSSAPVVIEATPHPTLSPLGARGEKATVASKKGDSVMPEDEREAEMVREKILPRVVPASMFDLDKEIKEATAAVFSRFGSALPKDIQERFRAIVESRLKGVRVASDTKESLIREPGKGGMGFGVGLAENVTAEIERMSRLINNKREEAMNKEKDAFSKTSVLNTAAKDESRKRGEQDEIERLYSSLTMKKGKATIVEAKTVEAKPLQAPQREVSPQARMHDVRAVAPAAARLTGPIEELRNLTIADFRRLSADPIEACRKLTDKLDLLQEQAYARRIEGIKAWQGSEVQKMYLEVITAAFGGGKPIAAAIADAQVAGRPTLTEREVHAIMEFNRQIKA